MAEFIAVYIYDFVKPEFLWSLVIRHIPNLKKDVEQIITEYGISAGGEDSQTPN